MACAPRTVRYECLVVQTMGMWYLVQVNEESLRWKPHPDVLLDKAYLSEEAHGSYFVTVRKEAVLASGCSQVASLVEEPGTAAI